MSRSIDSATMRLILQSSSSNRFLMLALSSLIAMATSQTTSTSTMASEKSALSSATNANMSYALLTSSQPSSTTAEVPVWEHAYYTFTRKINIIGAIVIIFIGLIGNGLAVYVFAQKRFRMHSSSIYLLFLAISDGLFLLMHFFEDTLRTYLDVYSGELGENNILKLMNITDRFTFTCRLVNYFRYFLRFVSAYIIIIFTIQRTIAIHSPLFQTRYESKKIAWLIVFLLTVIGAITNLWVPFLFTLNDVPSSPSQYCDVHKQFSSEYFVITIIYIVLIMLIPIVVIFFCNTLIMLSILRASKTRESMSNANLQSLIKRKTPSLSSFSKKNSLKQNLFTTSRSNSNSYNNHNNHNHNSRCIYECIANSSNGKYELRANHHRDSREPQSSMTTRLSHDHNEETPFRKSSFMESSSILNETTINGGGGGNNKNYRHCQPSIRTIRSQSSRTVNESKVTRMLIVMSLSYAILNLPYFITWCLFFSRAAFADVGEGQRLNLFSAINLSEIFYVLNYGIHFFIYCASGQRFRSQLRNAFKLK